MKFSRSSIHRCVTKKVARKFKSFSRGATNVRCDFTAWWKVRTMLFAGIRVLAVAPRARARADAPAMNSRLLSMNFTDLEYYSTPVAFRKHTNAPERRAENPIV